MAFGFLLFFIILTLIRPQDFMSAVRGWPLVDITMVFVTIFWLFEYLNYKKRHSLKVPQNILMICFWIVIILATHMSVHWATLTFNTAIEWGKYIYIYFLMISILNTQRRLRIFIWTMVISAAFTATMGVLQYYGVDITGVGMVGDQRIRGVGIFDTNQLAYFLAFCVPLAFGFFVSSRSAFVKLIAGSSIFIYACCIILTKSRGGIICLATVVILTLLIFAKRKFVKLFCIFIGALFVLALIGLSPRLLTTKDYKTDASAIGRIDVWGQALTTIKSRPFGIGKDQFVDNFGRASHNSYIQSVSELGVLGLFIWLSLFYFSLKNLKIISNLKVNKPVDIRHKAFSNSLQASLYAYLVGSLFSGNAYYITLYILFALVVAIQNTANFDLYKRKGSIKITDFIKIGFAEIGIILFIYKLINTIY